MSEPWEDFAPETPVTETLPWEDFATPEREPAKLTVKPKELPVPGYPLDPRFSQAALGGMGAVPYQIAPEHQGVMEPGLQLPRWYPKSTTAKIIAAPVNVAEGLVESTTVPAFAPLLAGGPLLSKAGALVGPSAGVLSKIAPVVERAVPKVLGLGFGVPAAYEGAKQIYEGKGELQPTLEGALNVGVGGLMVGAPFASQRPAPVQGPLATGEVLRTPEGAKPPPQTEIVIQAEPPEAKVEPKLVNEADELAALKSKDLTEEGLTKAEENRLIELSRKETIANRLSKTAKIVTQLEEAGVVVPEGFLNPSEGVQNHITGWTRDGNGFIQIRVETHTAGTVSPRLITVKPGDTLKLGMNDAVVGTTRYRESNPEAKVEAKPEAVEETSPVATKAKEPWEMTLSEMRSIVDSDPISAAAIRVGDQIFSAPIHAEAVYKAEEKLGRILGDGDIDESGYTTKSEKFVSQNVGDVLKNMATSGDDAYFSNVAQAIQAGEKVPKNILDAYKSAEEPTPEPAKPPLSEPGKGESVVAQIGEFERIKAERDALVEQRNIALGQLVDLRSEWSGKDRRAWPDDVLEREAELEKQYKSFRRGITEKNDVLYKLIAKSPVAKPEGTAVAGEEGQPGTVTAAPGTASQLAAKAKPEAKLSQAQSDYDQFIRSGFSPSDALKAARVIDPEFTPKTLTANERQIQSVAAVPSVAKVETPLPPTSEVRTGIQQESRATTKLELQTPEEVTAGDVQKLATSDLGDINQRHPKVFSFDISEWTRNAKSEAQSIPDTFTFVPEGSNKLLIEFPAGTRPQEAIQSLVEAIKQGDGPGADWLPTSQFDAIKTAFKDGKPVLASAADQHGIKPPRGYIKDGGIYRPAPKAAISEAKPEVGGLQEPEEIRNPNPDPVVQKQILIGAVSRAEKRIKEWRNGPRSDSPSVQRQISEYQNRVDQYRKAINDLTAYESKSTPSQEPGRVLPGSAVGELPPSPQSAGPTERLPSGNRPQPESLESRLEQALLEAEEALQKSGLSPNVRYADTVANTRGALKPGGARLSPDAMELRIIELQAAKDFFNKNAVPEPTPPQSPGKAGETGQGAAGGEAPLPTKAVQTRITSALKAIDQIATGTPKKHVLEGALIRLRGAASKLGIEVPSPSIFFSVEEYRKLARNAQMAIGQKFGSHPTAAMREARDRLVASKNLRVPTAAETKPRPPTAPIIQPAAAKVETPAQFPRIYVEGHAGVLKGTKVGRDAAAMLRENKGDIPLTPENEHRLRQNIAAYKLLTSGSAIRKLDAQLSEIDRLKNKPKAAPPETAQPAAKVEAEVKQAKPVPVWKVSYVDLEARNSRRPFFDQTALSAGNTRKEAIERVQAMFGAPKYGEFRASKAPAGTKADYHFEAPKAEPPPKAATPEPIGGELGPVANVVPEGPGALTAGTRPNPKATIEELTESFQNISGKKTPLVEKIREAFNFGRQRSAAKDALSATVSGLKTSGDWLIGKWRGVNTIDDLLRAKGELSAQLETRGWRIRQWEQRAKQAVPRARDQAAIAKWVDAGGDPVLLRQGRDQTRSEFKQAYEDALNLKGDMLVAAQNIRNYFEARLQEAIDAGVLKDGVEDYIHRMYESRPNVAKRLIANVQAALLQPNPSLAKRRIFTFDWEAEQLGYKPVQSFIPRIAQYESALSKAIASRDFIKKAAAMKAADGRPVIDIKGVGVPIEDPVTFVREATLIKPSFNPAFNREPFLKDGSPNPNYRGDYANREYPALSRWKWVAADTAGNPILVQGDVAIHPDYVVRIDKLLKPSAIRAFAPKGIPVGRWALGAGATFKQTMLDFSGFHQVQITVHGLEHKVNPFNIVQDINFENPNVQGLLKGGITLGGDYAYHKEGLVGSSLSRQIPILGPLMESYHSWLFQSYIPRVKMTMALKALERNRKRYAGQLTDEQILNKTALQANSAFGELNYIMLERGKTGQDIARLILLAPDFLEARGRFAAEAFTKGGKSKVPGFGNEQRAALILGAITMYVTARMMNRAIDDQWHLEPENAFSLVYKNHAYGLRTVQGDILHLLERPLQFWLNRLNPVYGRTLLEIASGRDYFGRKRTIPEILWDSVVNIQPIGTRHSRERRLWESLMQSFGGNVRRYNATDDAFKLAAKWKDKNGIVEPGEFIYDSEKDPLRPLKIALSLNDEAAATKEIGKLLESGIRTRSKLNDYFKRYATMHFAGSASNDKKFYQSLSEDERKTVDAAREYKRTMLTLYRQARDKYEAALMRPANQ